MLAQLTRQLLTEPQPLRFLIGLLITVPLASVMAVGAAYAMGGLVEPLFGVAVARPAFLFGFCSAGAGTIVAVDRAMQVVWPARRR